VKGRVCLFFVSQNFKLFDFSIFQSGA